MRYKIPRLFENVDTLWPAHCNGPAHWRIALACLSVLKAVMAIAVGVRVPHPPQAALAPHHVQVVESGRHASLRCWCGLNRLRVRVPPWTHRARVVGIRQTRSAQTRLGYGPCGFESRLAYACPRIGSVLSTGETVAVTRGFKSYRGHLVP